MFLERPEISILLLTHNRPEGLRRAVESIYRQTFKKFELIIIDNGSEISYPDCIKDYLISKKNLRYIQCKENEEFLGIRWNQGLSLSNGKYITFLMDDDIWESDTLKNLHLEISKNLDFVYGRVMSIDSVSKKQVRNTFSTTDWQKGTCKRINPIHMTSVIVKRDLFNKLGGFHEYMFRSYDLDMWNRIFKESKCHRLDKVVSQISVNSLSSVTGVRSLDKPIPMSEYPLINYWSDRKSISFLGDERKFINQLNSRNQSWIATHDSLSTDATVSWAYTPGLDDFDGTRFYYIDHPAIIQPSMVRRCDGIISQFYLDTDKPLHILRPTITQQTLLDVDRFIYLNQKNLKILCPKITEDNLDFIYVLLDHLSDRYRVIYFYIFDNIDAVALLRDIKNVFPKILKEDDYTYFKKLSIDVVLHVEGDSNSYVDAYKDFLISSVIRAPLVSSPNIAYENILKHDEDIYIADTVQKYMKSIVKTKDLEIREPLVDNMRKKTHLYFLDQVVLDKFILFLNNTHNPIPNNPTETVSISQLESNSSVILHSGEYITQSFISKTSRFNAIQFFGTSLSNQDGSIRFVLKQDDTLLTEIVLPNYKLKNGVNTVQFEEIQDAENKEFTFTLYGDVPIFKLDYANYILGDGSYFSNGISKKACLKFNVLENS